MFKSKQKRLEELNALIAEKELHLKNIKENTDNLDADYRKRKSEHEERFMSWWLKEREEWSVKVVALREECVKQIAEMEHEYHSDMETRKSILAGLQVEIEERKKFLNDDSEKRKDEIIDKLIEVIGVKCQK